MSESPRPRSSPRCRYCGRELVTGGVCAEHRELEQHDPHAAAAGEPLSEEDHGVRPAWPESEAVDDGGPA